MAERQIPGRRTALLVLQAIGLIAVYYLVPIGEGSTGRTWARAGGAALLLAVVLWYVVRTVAREVRAESAAVHVDRLALAVIAGVVCFALVDYVVARLDADQFAGLATKTDALYFALTTLTTVGYGDVHPVGQLARQIVIAQLLFNLVVVAAAARTLTRELARRRARPGDDVAGNWP
ncbi:potassium channel family protein [Geodermatophilus sp. URMC 64]